LNESLIKQIDAILPQTQCGQCGFSGCEPYARAIVEKRADINQCPPGNDDGIRNIARLLGVNPKPLNTRHGIPKPRAVAVIDENLCIGCTFCIQACPVDAILGAAKQMHTVLSDECTGCELCVAPCPMDCITLIPANLPCGSPDTIAAEMKRKADQARIRYQSRQKRLALKKAKHGMAAANSAPDRTSHTSHTDHPDSDTGSPENHSVPQPESRKQAIVQMALKRAAALREATH